MILRLLIPALIAGIAGGFVVTGLHQTMVVPMIDAAEAIAHGHDHGHDHDHGDHAHENGDHGHSHDGWMPTPGGERFSFTLLSNVLAGTGFALLLTAGMVLPRSSLTVRHGLVWGAAGFVTFMLAPSLGLPPELPGAAHAPLEERQLWWLGTVIATGGGLAIIAFAQPLWAKAIGVVPLLVPHVIGAPGPAEGLAGVISPELASQFVVVSLTTGLVFWLILGGVAATVLQRVSRRPA